MKLEKKDVRHFLAVGGILCGVSAVAALAIGLTNMVTAPLIAENQEAAIQEALSTCFSNDIDVFSDDIAVEGKDYVYSYRISYSNEEKTETYGYIFRGTGSNTYGSVDIAIGLRNDESGELVYGKIGMIENTESYKTILENKYVSVYNANPSSDTLNDVNCGATKGANLIRKIVNEAVDMFENGEVA